MQKILQDVAQLVEDYIQALWPVGLVALIFIFARFNRIGHRDLIAREVLSRGLGLVRISPVQWWTFEYSKDYSRTRGGGKFYLVTVKSEGVDIRQLWIVEAGKARQL